MPGAKNGQLWVLGLTGGIACGKSSASSFLAGLGANVIDADKISRAVTAPGGEALPAIAQTFGSDMLDADGHLDRRRLAQVVFSDDASRRALEGIIHPLVQQATLRRIRELAAAGANCAVLDVPLLYETGMDVLCDEVWLLAGEAHNRTRWSGRGAGASAYRFTNVHGRKTGALRPRDMDQSQHTGDSARTGIAVATVDEEGRKGTLNSVERLLVR